VLRYLKWASPVLVLALFVLALGVLGRELHHYRAQDIRAALEAIPLPRFLSALSLTALSYAVLSLYDWLGLRYAGRKLDYGRVALASFSAYVFSYNVGFSVLGGAAVRYRLYSSWGLSALEIGKLVLFTTVTFWLGLATLMGTVLLTGAASGRLGLPVWTGRSMGVLLLSLMILYVAACAWVRRPLRLRQIELVLPTLPLALCQVLLAIADLLVAGLVLFVLFPGHDVALPVFLGAYLTAMAAGLVSHVPGGLGVFETVIVLILPTTAPHPDLIAMLLSYRLIYYLGPFLLGLVLVGGHTAFRQRRRLAGFGELVAKGVALVTPRVLTFAVFFSGVVLLVSGATPASGSRLAWLGNTVPLGMLEVSHFLASVIGVTLLFLARGLQLRLNAAWAATLGLLLLGALVSLLKGLDYEEAVILLLAASALAVSRHRFRRPSSLWDHRFSPGWVAGIGLALLGTTWLGLFAYKHVEYSSELWWQFEVTGQAPRFLRASVGVAAVVLAVGLARLFRLAYRPPAGSDPADLEVAITIAASSPASAANLIALGDKALLFSQTRQSFLMYGVSGRSWVVMGDPVGVAEEAEELIWSFREQCDAAGAWPVFYEVSPARLPLYVDLGLSLFKLGEEARVWLADFSLEGGHRKKMRQTRSKLEAAGCTFAIWEPAEVAMRLEELKAVSDVWLRGKNTREKGFSLGFFTTDYVRRFPASVVLLHGRVVAFATVWRSGQQEELSIDLMRQLEEAPDGVMEYLFLRLMLLGKEQGYRWFNLGMAPFSGIERHPLAPWWNRVGSLLFRHGEHFYNFQGLRQYKEKFDPVWEPKYLACSGGLMLPQVLANVSALVSGGLSGLIRK